MTTATGIALDIYLFFLASVLWSVLKAAIALKQIMRSSERTIACLNRIGMRRFVRLIDNHSPVYGSYEADFSQWRRDYRATISCYVLMCLLFMIPFLVAVYFCTTATFVAAVIGIVVAAFTGPTYLANMVNRDAIESLATILLSARHDENDKCDLILSFMTSDCQPFYLSLIEAFTAHLVAPGANCLEMPGIGYLKRER